MTTMQEHLTLVWKMTLRDKVLTNPAKRETEDETKEECTVATVTHMIDGKQFVSLQVNCKSIYNRTLDLWNLINTYNPEDVIGKESWLSEEFNNAEVFRADYTTCRRDRHNRGDSVYLCKKLQYSCQTMG
jgi:hypothetical protein